MIASKKTRKALIGSIVVAVLQIAAVIAEHNGINVPTEYLVTLSASVGTLFGLDIAGHALTDIKKGNSNAVDPPAPPA